MSSIYFTCTLGIVLGVIICLSDFKTAYGLTFISLIFEHVAFARVGSNTILVYHICCLVLVVKYLVYCISHRCSVGINIYFVPYLIFVGYCFLSIFFVHFNSGIWVVSVDSGFSFSRFSMQQFTQYMYLILPVILMIISYDLMDKELLNSQYLWELVKGVYLLSIIIGFVQLVIPIDIYNALLKNDSIGAINQTITLFGKRMVRIDSTFGEASMFSLFLLPILFMLLYEFIKKPNWTNLCLIVMGLLIILENRSSCSVVGVICFAASIFIQIIYKILYSRRILRLNSKMVRNTVCGICLIAMFCITFWNSIQSNFLLFLSKISGIHASGKDRFRTMQVAFEAFKHSPLFGIGFGTMRSLDLFSDWLGQIGILGVLLYFIPVIALLHRLLKCRDDNATKFFIGIFVYNGIMFTAVPEFRYPFIWIYYAVAYAIISENRKKGFPYDWQNTS